MKLFFWDIDGTILNSAGAGRSAMYEAYRKIYNEEPFESPQTFHGRTDKSIMTELLEGSRKEVTPEAINRIEKVYVECLPEHMRSTSKAGQSHVLPGVAELLDWMHSSDQCELALLTGNFADGAREKLAAFDLHEYFPFGAYGDLSLHRNDVAAHGWDLAIKRYPGLQPDQVWVIGDTPADIECAKSIGVKVLAVATGINSVDDLSQYEPDLVRESLADWRDVIEAVTAATH